MRVAVISDVHSNLPALRAVLDALDEEDPDEVVCLGDTVGYAAHPAECLDLVRERCSLVLKGNHDAAVAAGEPFAFNRAAAAGVDHAREVLDDDTIAYLDGLDPLVRRERVCYVHGSPRDPIREYVFPDLPDDEMRAVAGAADADHLWMGHTHVPMAVTVAGVQLRNPGSVGQPRDGDPRAAFAIWDRDEGTVETRRVGYDVDAAVEAIREAGLPEPNGKRLRTGR